MKRDIRRNKKALSPVIATVILVAVTIVVAVSVAYWMGTIASSYTTFEQIELPSAYPEYVASGLKVVTGEAVGTGDATGTKVFYLDNIPVLDGSEKVYVDGTLKMKPADYSIDYATGTITFTTAPTQGALITADYSGVGGWKVFVELKNTGSADATIDNVFLNAKPLKDYTTLRLFDGSELPEDQVLDLSAISIRVVKGQSKKVILYIQEGTEGCTSGTTVDIKFHTAAGIPYPTHVKLT